MFGHREIKATCLWLKGLPLLKPTNIIYPSHSHINNSVRRWTDRSRTFTGIAKAMAEQWG